MAREYFCAYHSALEAMEGLSDAERGRLFTALLIYSKTGTAPQLSGNERFVFPGMRSQIDRDQERYRAFSEKQSQNGRKGGRPSKPTETQKTQTFSEKPKKTKEKEKAKEKESNNPLTPLEGEIQNFIEYRKKIRAPMTEHAVDLMRKKLRSLSADEQEQIEILRQSQLNGWKGVFPLRDKQASDNSIWSRRLGE